MKITRVKRNKKIRTIALVLFLSLLMLSNILYSALLSEEGKEQEKINKKKNRLIFLPIIYYTPETKIAAGVGGIYYFRTSKSGSEKRPSSILMDLVYTGMKQVLLEFFPDIYIRKGEYHLIGSLSYKKYTEKFFGVGNTTSEDMEENYSFRAARLDLSFQKKVSEQLYIGIQYEFESNRIIETEGGGQLEKGDILGSEGGTASGFGLVLNWDNRDNIFFPTQGRFYQISAKFFNKAFGSNFNFNRFNLNLSQYFSFFSSHVLVFQSYINIVTGHPPFQMLSLLGGQNLMRGYYKGRYRDKNMIALQMEYRIPVWWRLGLVGFIGYGDVADELSHFKFGGFKYSRGWGIRYKISREEGTNLRLDFGFGRGTSGVYVTVNEAF